MRPAWPWGRSARIPYRRDMRSTSAASSEYGRRGLRRRSWRQGHRKTLNQLRSMALQVLRQGQVIVASLLVLALLRPRPMLAVTRLLLLMRACCHQRLTRKHVQPQVLLVAAIIAAAGAAIERV